MSTGKNSDVTVNESSRLKLNLPWKQYVMAIAMIIGLAVTGTSYVLSAESRVVKIEDRLTSNEKTDEKHGEKITKLEAAVNEINGKLDTMLEILQAKERPRRGR